MGPEGKPQHPTLSCRGLLGISVFAYHLQENQMRAVARANKMLQCLQSFTRDQGVTMATSGVSLMGAVIREDLTKKGERGGYGHCRTKGHPELACWDARGSRAIQLPYRCLSSKDPKCRHSNFHIAGCLQRAYREGWKRLGQAWGVSRNQQG